MSLRCAVRKWETTAILTAMPSVEVRYQTVLPT